MDSLAFTTRGWDVPSNRWIANLSDGRMVFEDIRRGEPSAWRRLAKFVEENDLLITGLRLQAYGTSVTALPYRGKDGQPQIDGYWQAKNISAILGPTGDFPQRLDHGVGYVMNDRIHIAWICEDKSIRNEVRKIVGHDPVVVERRNDRGEATFHEEMGCIWNKGSE